jgi:hypothetical protein
MARRSLDRRGGFVRPQLTSALALLDAGYGQRTITCDIASAVGPGCGVGLDLAGGDAPPSWVRWTPSSWDILWDVRAHAAVSLAQLASGANRSTMLPSGSRTVA